MSTRRLAASKKEMALVRAVFPDAKVFEVDADYEFFHAIVDGVRMIFYPHTTKSTGNYHTRVRNGTALRKSDFLALVACLQSSQGPQCTFHAKNAYLWQTDKIRAQSQKYENHWKNAEEIYCQKREAS